MRQLSKIVGEEIYRRLPEQDQSVIRDYVEYGFASCDCSDRQLGSDCARAEALDYALSEICKKHEISSWKLDRILIYLGM